VGLLTETVNTNVEIIGDKTVLQNVTEKINEIYKQIKKTEEAPKTEYLFRGLEKQKTLKKSILQMEMMNKLDVVNSNDN
jgi:hypothetical protein